MTRLYARKCRCNRIPFDHLPPRFAATVLRRNRAHVASATLRGELSSLALAVFHLVRNVQIQERGPFRLRQDTIISRCRNPASCHQKRCHADSEQQLVPHCALPISLGVWTRPCRSLPRPHQEGTNTERCIRAAAPSGGNDVSGATGGVGRLRWPAAGPGAGPSSRFSRSVVALEPAGLCHRPAHGLARADGVADGSTYQQRLPHVSRRSNTPDIAAQRVERLSRAARSAAPAGSTQR